MTDAPDLEFRIETNLHFPRETAAPLPEFSEVCRAFGWDSFDRVERIQKRNALSVLYRVTSGGEVRIFRQTSVRDRTRLEQQCATAERMSERGFLRPLRTAEGHYTAEAAGRAWTAYPEIPGEIFSGDNCAVGCILDRTLDLFRAFLDLERTAPPDARSALPIVHSDPSRWPDWMELLTNPGRLPPVLAGALDDSVRSLLRNRRDWFRREAVAAAELDPGPAGLTHYDLHHANIVVHHGIPHFLDVEDIGIDRPEIALAHVIFKLLRHLVFTGTRTVAQVRRHDLPLALRLASARGFRPATALELARYGNYRIFSDLDTIVDFTVMRDDPVYLFDLQKRVLNLVELRILTDSADGPSTAG